MQFLKNIFASIIGFFIAMVLIFFLFIASMVGLASSFESEPAQINPGVLALDFSNRLMDFYPGQDQAIYEILDQEAPYTSMSLLLTSIREAKTDDRIKGISIQLNGINGGMSQIKELREALKDFKNSGKPLYAYADVYSQGAYYLASVADRIYVNPAGDVQWMGLSAELLFFKEFEEKYGLKMEVIRHGKYKSAMEPFLEQEMSEANREQMTVLLESLWSSMKNDISIDRENLDAEKLQAIADKVLARTPGLAEDMGMIEGPLYWDEYKEIWEEEIDGSSRFISIGDYMTNQSDERYSSNGNIAVLYAQGEIIYGDGSYEEIGQNTQLEALNSIKDDASIQALVLRVNSPGGSALASDIILRAIEQIGEDIPVVVSMGDYAASGGYYIATKAEVILAQENTITGSIGVFGALPNAYEFTKRIGINADQVSTSKAPSYSIFEPMSRDFHDLTKEGIERVYDDFITHVAEGRSMTKEEVDRIAQGRVWSGKQALEIGLVDRLGGLDEAIEIAAELAELSDYGVMRYPEIEDDFNSLFSGFGVWSAPVDALIKKMDLLKTDHLIQESRQLSRLNGIQMRMPYAIEFN